MSTRSMIAAALAAALLAAPITHAVQADPTAVSAFPGAWFGTWRGPMTTGVPGGELQALEMELVIAPTDDHARFTWTIVYIDGERHERPYTLVTVDAGAGKYAIDEHNGIILDAFLVGDGLYSQFAMGATSLTASYRLEGERLVVELVTTTGDRIAVTGGENGVPEIKMAPVTAVQRAALTRQ